MLEVVSHVVSAERKHSHGIATDNADCAGCCCGGLGSHYRADEHAVVPILRLVYQRSGSFARRPPKMIAEIGTPAPFPNSSEMQGQFFAGAVNLEFG